MASISWLTCRRLSRLMCPFSQVARRPVLQYVWTPTRALHRGSARRAAEKNPLNRTRAVEQQYITELDKADALMLRKSHETGFLSWFRNGLLATGIGIIAFVQSDVGREAGYAFFILGGVCVSFGGASYVGSLLTLRRIMLLSLPAVLLHTAVVSSAALFWLCAVSLYIGRLEVEIIHDEDEEEPGERKAGSVASAGPDARDVALKRKAKTSERRFELAIYTDPEPGLCIHKLL